MPNQTGCYRYRKSGSAERSSSSFFASSSATLVEIPFIISKVFSKLSNMIVNASILHIVGGFRDFHRIQIPVIILFMNQPCTGRCNLLFDFISKSLIRSISFGRNISVMALNFNASPVIDKVFSFSSSAKISSSTPEYFFISSKTSSSYKDFNICGSSLPSRDCAIAG